MINSKHEEIKSLSDIIRQANENRDELLDKLASYEKIIEDVEEKNKRLVELLNVTMYNKAEQYKEKVFSKL